MKVRMPLFASVLIAAFALANPVAAQTTLNVVTAGDQNMVDYVNNYLAPKFEQMNPGVKVRAVGTGPGDAGSQKIYEKLSAQQKANAAEWDVDVAVIHQLASATMVREKLLLPYRNEVSVGKMVSRDTAKNALGADVDGRCRDAVYAQSRRDRDGTSLGRHVLYLAERWPHEPEDEACTAISGTAGAADVLRHSGEGCACRVGEEVHRVGREP